MFGMWNMKKKSKQEMGTECAPLTFNSRDHNRQMAAFITESIRDVRPPGVGDAQYDNVLRIVTDCLNGIHTRYPKPVVLDSGPCPRGGRCDQELRFMYSCEKLNCKRVRVS